MNKPPKRIAREKKLKRLELKFTVARAECPDLQDKQLTGVGNPCAPLMLIMDAPNDDDEAERSSFASASAKMLKEMLVKLHLRKSKVYMTYAVKFVPKILRKTYRQGDTRAPSDDEIAAFTSSLLEEISIVKPRVIVAVGGTVCKMLLDSAARITEVRGRVMDSPLVDCPVMPILHPSFLARTGGSHSRFYIQTMSDLREAKRIANREKVNLRSLL